MAHRWSAAILLAVCATACVQKSRPPPMASPPPQQPPPQQQPPWLGGGWVPPFPGGWTPPWQPPPAGWSQDEFDVIKAVNAHRARGGFCGNKFFYPSLALTPHPALHHAARGHSWDMANRNYYSHQSPEGSSPSDRVRQAGYRNGAAENIDVGAASSQQVVADWMSSPGHCENFMDPNNREIGIGHAYLGGSQYGHYWTANLGRGG